uniref:putative F-box/LRR-repeat protein At5g02700 n=1 Tax=Erigeron canadensis TaxID=72917 RepID=UPI001CB8CFF5|nr:putative F-box/LRR-repeat protein At5g02700 [Erigeron canadensis]
MTGKVIQEKHSDDSCHSKFEVDCNYDARFASDVKSWIQFAVTKCVKDFKLYFRNSGDEDSYSIKNQSFYKCSHFTTLDIGYCLFQPKYVLAWKNLMKLTISDSILEDDLIPNIVSGSPLLPTFVLRDCCAYVIRILSPSVKRLEIHGHEADHLETLLEIVAPYITDLYISESLWIENISLNNVSSVVKAYLNFKFPQLCYKVKKPYAELILGEMIVDLQDAKEIEIGVRCYPILCRMAAKGYTLAPNVVGVDTSSMYYVDSDVDVSD